MNKQIKDNFLTTWLEDDSFKSTDCVHNKFDFKNLK